MYMCVYRKVEDELSVCLKTKTPSFTPKKKLKLCICVWTSMTWLRALESTHPFKIAFKTNYDNYKLGDEKLKHDIKREAAKISALSSEKIDNYEYFIGEEILPSDQGS